MALSLLTWLDEIREENKLKLAISAILSTCMVVAFSEPQCRASTLQLGISGDAQIGSNFIDFGQYPNGAPYTPAPGYGTYEVSLVNAGIFSNAGVTTGEFGMIQSLNEGTGTVTLPSAFMTFDAGGSNLSLYATSVPAGTVGPYFLTNTAEGAVASFNVDGTIKDSNNPSLQEQFTGTFSITFDGVSVAQLFGDLPVNTPFSATFGASDATTNTPEPASLLLIGAGLLGVGAMSRRGRSRLISARL